MLSNSKLAAMLLLAPALAYAENNCDQTCNYATEVAVVLNKNVTKIGTHFSPGGFSSNGRRLMASFRFKGDQGDLDDLLTSTHKDLPIFRTQLDQVADNAGCMQPVRRLILAGGSAEFVFALEDGVVFHRHVVEKC